MSLIPRKPASAEELARRVAAKPVSKPAKKPTTVASEAAPVEVKETV